MARVSAIKKSASIIIDYLNSLGVKTFSLATLEAIHSSQKSVWGLPRTMNAKRFITALLDNNILILVEMISAQNTTRYLYRLALASDFDIVNTLNRKGYFTHYTALSFHNLTLQIPKIFYLNIEHENKNKQIVRHLNQSEIDSAFSNEQRRSSNELRWNNSRIVLLRGQYTKHLGVETYKTSNGVFQMTDIERTLIDAVIRPAYCGGVTEVLTAFETAKNIVDIDRLAEYLHKLDYLYPYHQAIGFYLDRANYPEIALGKFRSLAKEFKFYLTYNIRQKEYDSNWKIFYPKGL